MHVDRAERLTRPREELGELLDVLGQFRWRLAREQVLLFGVRGLIISAAVLIGLSVTAWLLGISYLNATVVAALIAVPLAGALVGLVRWPSPTLAALAADKHLGLAERLSTALELAERPAAGRFDMLQLRDAIATARSTTQRWPSAFESVRGEAVLAAVLVVLALGSLALPLAPRPTLPSTNVDPLAADQAAVEAERVITPAMVEVGAAAEPVAPATAEADLAPRVEQALAEREALEKLAEALSSISAGQGAADAIERGDFAGAREQLATLAEEADQLSDAAKKRLSQALQAAANATTGDRALADRERQAAQALSRSNYGEQRNALRQLGEQLERSGARSMSQGQLARESGRLQQQQATSGGQQSTSRTQAQSSGQASGGQAQSSAGQQPGDTGTSGTGSEGEQSGLGAGSGATEPLGAANDSLGTVGERVEVPTKLSAGPGERPIDGSEDEASANPGVGVRSVAEATYAQHTGQVAPEQNLVPGEQRPVVREYFR